MSTHDVITDQLHDVLEKDPELAELVTRSIVRAGEIARQDLDQDLYAALEWPRDLDEYEQYLGRLVRWIPRAREVSDRLAHFFWLVDQPVGEGATAIAESSEVFRGWLTQFARRWGDFLDTVESFSPDILRTFLEDAPEYHVEDSMVDGRPNTPSGWLTFNQFFARELNAGLRPVSDSIDNRIVTSPADCSYCCWYDIDDKSNIPLTRVKNTVYGNVTHLIAGSRYATAFAGGTFVHYTLSPSAYHRFHFPVAGRVEESFVIRGKVFMQVDLSGGRLSARDAASTGYPFSQTRGVVTVDTSVSGLGDLGVVAVIPVGMAHVASVTLTATDGRQVAKGDEFGFFGFGGSDIIILLPSGVDPQVDTSTAFRHVGSPVARGRVLTDRAARPSAP